MAATGAADFRRYGMRVNTIINRYLLSEMIAPFAICVGFFTFIFMMARMLEITNLIVNYDVGFGSILMLIGFTLPSYLVYVIPMSAMTAVLLTFMRLSGDNEILAIKAGGGSLYGLLPPVMLFCILCCAASVLIAVFAAPLGLTASNALAYRLALSHADIGLKERTFNNSFKKVVIYVSAFDQRSGELLDVFIEDQRKKNLVSTVTAHRARLFSNPETLVYQLRLFDGTILQTGLEDRSAHAIRFETYDIRLDIRQAVSVSKFTERKRPMMTLNELLQHIRKAQHADDITDYYKGLVELHKKFALPFACIALGLLAVPVGITTRSSKRSTGLVFALVLFFFYYMLMTGGLVGAEGGKIPPWVGMWAPNLIMGMLGMYLLARNTRERPVRFKLLNRILR